MAAGFFYLNNQKSFNRLGIESTSVRMFLYLCCLKYDKVLTTKLQMNQILKKEAFSTNLIYLALLLLTGLSIALNCNFESSWFDEFYSLHIIRHSYADIWTITTDDVHPPLYYWILKFLGSVFGDSMLTMHFLSSIPLVCTFLLSRTVVARLWGHRTAILFYLITLFHSATIYMMSDIRMYGWASFLVLATFVFGWSYLKEKRASSLILLSFFAVLSAYTHYYALLAIFFVYLFLMLGAYISKDKKSLVRIIISSLLAFLLYIPWLINMLNQVATVTDDYWIETVNISLLGRTLNLFHEYVYLGVVVTAAFVSYGIYALWKERKFDNLNLSLSLLVLSQLPALSGIIISFLIRPVFLVRYSYCAVMLLFLGLAIMLASLDRQKKFNRALIIVVLAGMVVSAAIFVGKEIPKKQRIDKSLHAIHEVVDEELADSTAFIYHYDYIREEFPLWTLYYPEAHHVCKTVDLKDRLQLVEMIPHEQIDDYAVLPDRYDKLLYISNNFYPFMGSKEDSLAVDKLYEINRLVNVENRSLYRLTKR